MKAWKYTKNGIFFKKHFKQSTFVPANKKYSWFKKNRFITKKKPIEKKVIIKTVS